MMFVLEPIHMLANLTTYTYYNLSWHDISPTLSKRAYPNLFVMIFVDCAMVPRRLIVMYAFEMVCYLPCQHGQGADLNPRDDIMYQSLYTM